MVFWVFVVECTNDRVSALWIKTDPCAKERLDRCWRAVFGRITSPFDWDRNEIVLIAILIASDTFSIEAIGIPQDRLIFPVCTVVEHHVEHFGKSRLLTTVPFHESGVSLIQIVAQISYAAIAAVVQVSTDESLNFTTDRELIF